MQRRWMKRKISHISPNRLPHVSNPIRIGIVSENKSRIHETELRPKPNKDAHRKRCTKRHGLPRGYSRTTPPTNKRQNKRGRQHKKRWLGRERKRHPRARENKPCHARLPRSNDKKSSAVPNKKTTRELRQARFPFPYMGGNVASSVGKNAGASPIQSPRESPASRTVPTRNATIIHRAASNVAPKS